MCQEFVYKSPDGDLEVIVVPVSDNNDEFIMRETINISSLDLPEGANVSEYSLLIRNKQLIRSSPRGEGILIEKPFIPNSNVWQNSLVSYSKGRTTEEELPCTIAATYKKKVFEEERFTIKTKCESNSDDIHMIIEQEYVKGIGMFSSSHNGLGIILMNINNICE